MPGSASTIKYFILNIIHNPPQLNNFVYFYCPVWPNSVQTLLIIFTHDLQRKHPVEKLSNHRLITHFTRLHLKNDNVKKVDICKQWWMAHCSVLWENNFEIFLPSGQDGGTYAKWNGIGRVFLESWECDSKMISVILKDPHVCQENRLAATFLWCSK